MTKSIVLPIFAVLAFGLTAIGSAQPALDFVETTENQDGKKELQPPAKKTPPEKKEPATDIFTQTPAMGPQFSTGFNPHMLGDFGAFFARRTITVTGTKTTTKKITTRNPDPMTGNATITRTVTTTESVTQTRTILVPGASSAGAFKIAENESPRPVDRVFCTYNFFGGIQGPVLGGNGPATQTVNSSTTFGRIPTTVDTTETIAFPNSPTPRSNLHRETFGFEKTFLDGYGSVELRLPLMQLYSNTQGFGSQQVGDLTIIGKYALLLDNETGNVFSLGMAVTAPTGPSFETVDGSIHSTLVQPWFGYIYNFDRVFIQAFHSIVVPTDSRDVTLMFNDVGLCYWLYRAEPNSIVNYVVPLVETHITTPLTQRNLDALIYVPDTVVITAGVHVGVFGYTTISCGVATPVTGLRPFNVEAFVQLNRRF